MDLASVFRSAIQIDGLAGREPKAVFDEIAGHLARASGLDDAARIPLRDAFLLREKEGTTAMGFGVAVPHVFHPTLAAVRVVVARHARGIDMGGLDGEPTRILIAVAAPDGEREAYRGLLKCVAGTVREPMLRRHIMKSPTAAGIVEVLVEASERLSHPL